MTRSSADPTAPPTPRRPVGPLAGSPQNRWVRARRVCPMASQGVIHSPHRVEAHTARTDSFAVRPQLRTRSLTRRGPTRYRSPVEFSGFCLLQLFLWFVDNIYCNCWNKCCLLIVLRSTKSGNEYVVLEGSSFVPLSEAESRFWGSLAGPWRAQRAIFSRILTF